MAYARPDMFTRRAAKNTMVGTGRVSRRDALGNRRRILEVARRAFADGGVDGTSMHRIGRLAGVGQGTLYRHFGHKGE